MVWAPFVELQSRACQNLVTLKTNTTWRRYLLVKKQYQKVSSKGIYNQGIRISEDSKNRCGVKREILDVIKIFLSQSQLLKNHLNTIRKIPKDMSTVSFPIGRIEIVVFN